MSTPGATLLTEFDTGPEARKYRCRPPEGVSTVSVAGQSGDTVPPCYGSTSTTARPPPVASASAAVGTAPKPARVTAGSADAAWPPPRINGRFVFGWTGRTA